MQGLKVCNAILPIVTELDVSKPHSVSGLNLLKQVKIFIHLIAGWSNRERIGHGRDIVTGLQSIHVCSNGYWLTPAALI